MPSIWIRPQLAPPAAVDTVIFDVDGVLWDTSGSYDSAILQTLTHLLTHFYNLSLDPGLDESTLRIFRRAGGLNNDWDLTYTLLALRLAGRTDYAAAAAESGGRGRAWAQQLLPAGVRLDYELVRTVFDEIYWGGEAYRGHFGREPRHLADAPGTWQMEVRLLPHDLLPRLRAMGVTYFGIATGRNRQELSTVLESSELSDWVPGPAIVTAEIAAKPAAAVLQRVVAGLQGQAGNGAAGPRAALYCGDTMDDLQAVLNYRDETAALGLAAAAWIGAVAVVAEPEYEYYARRGSDAAIAHIDALPDLIAAVNCAGGD